MTPTMTPTPTLTPLPVKTSLKSLMLKFVSSLQIMEAMALHLESSYEKLYRWSQGMQSYRIICMQSYRIIQ